MTNPPIIGLTWTVIPGSRHFGCSQDCRRYRLALAGERPLIDPARKDELGEEIVVYRRALVSIVTWPLAANRV